MSPELNRNKWDGVIYENKALGIEWDRYPLDYHFYPDDKVFPVEIHWFDLPIRNALQVGETSEVIGKPIDGNLCLVVIEGTQYVSGIHESHVKKINETF